jgi:sugar O-acyltransferase (sialic acid O-acetyltransferase NeuD family)
MAQVVIYGNGQVAGLAHHYLTTDSAHEVVAFTVDSKYLKDEEMLGLPVVPFDALPERFPAEGFEMFVAMGYGRVNRDRANWYGEVKRLGYRCVSYVSSNAIIAPNVVMGENVFIMEGCIIQPYVHIGNDVVMWSACHVGHETVINDHCFLSAHAVVSGNVIIEENAFLGVNCTIRNAIRLARESVIGAGAVILKDTEERGVYLAPRAELLAMRSDRLPGL